LLNELEGMLVLFQAVDIYCSFARNQLHISWHCMDSFCKLSAVAYRRDLVMADNKRVPWPSYLQPQMDATPGLHWCPQDISGC